MSNKCATKEDVLRAKIVALEADQAQLSIRCHNAETLALWIGPVYDAAIELISEIAADCPHAPTILKARAFLVLVS